MAELKNAEGYVDKTAYYAQKHVEKDEATVDAAAKTAIMVLKWVCDMSGFEFIGRIQIRHKASKKEYR